MRSRRQFFLAVIAFASSLFGQVTVIEIPLGGGLPAEFVGDTFATTDAVAVADPSAIRVWTGLPHKAAASILPLDANFRMASAWRRLDSASAAYDSVGVDLVAGTVDDELILVTGLPANPVVVPTAVARSARRGTVLRGRSDPRRSDRGGFHILRHEGALVGRDWVPVQDGLAVGGRFHCGAANGDIVFALGLGPDALAGTSDDRMVVLRDVASGAGRQPWITEHPLPAYLLPAGFDVTDEGVGVLWRPLVLPAFEFVEFRAYPWGSPTMVEFSAAQVIWTPAASIPPGMTPSFGAGPTPGGGFLFWNDDELAPGTGCVLLAAGLSRLEVAGSWYDDWNSGTHSSVLYGRDIVTTIAASPFGGFGYQRSTASGVLAFNCSVPLGDVVCSRPHAGAIVGFGIPYFAWPGPATAMLTVILDVFGQNRIVSSDLTGVWCGGVMGTPRVFALGAGRVGGFLASSGMYGAAPDRLCVADVPTATIEVAGPVTVWPYDVHLSFGSPIPAMGSPLTIGVDAPIAAEVALVGIAWQRGPSFLPANTVGVPIHLDLDTLCGAALLPLDNGRADLVVSTQNLPAVLNGVPIWVQALVVRPGYAQTSELGLVVLGAGVAATTL